MVGFLLALQFLTIIPVTIKDVDEKKIARSIVYFPLAGLFIGMLLSAAYVPLCSLHLASLTVSIILVVALIVITGGMHLDGLADTGDALLSVKPKDQMLAIMRDPHIGVMGALSLISIILLKIGLLFSLGASAKIPALLLMCVLSRWSAVLTMYLFPYARQDGKAKVFSRGMNAKIAALSSILALVCSFAIWQLKGVAAFLVIGGFVYVSGKIISRSIGGMTGDTLGATIELSEVATLLIACAI